ncbi:DUF2057 family protein [Ferrimonas kyonanensis]|uniref:DUF2057 family protein n=1 Tax=Ferrimonas kyonanensis TaxID=364763 RepID=UPI00040A8D56|nr:DUF2057 family protein [Ferrimonas kyonanensis]
MRALLFALILSAPGLEAATLPLPDGVSLLSINGNAAPRNDQPVTLKPGTQVIQLSYTELLTVTPEEHELLRSTPVFLSFIAGEGDYRVRLPELNNSKAIRAFIDEPTFTLLEGKTPHPARQLTETQLMAQMARLLAKDEG